MGDKERIMSFADSDIDATDPKALQDALGSDTVDGCIMAARIGSDGDSSTLATDIAPNGAPNGGCVVAVADSRIGRAITTAYEPAQIPDVQIAASAAFNAEALANDSPAAEAKPAPSPAFGPTGGSVG